MITGRQVGQRVHDDEDNGAAVDRDDAIVPTSLAIESIL